MLFRKRSKKPQAEPPSVGGLAFFASLVFLSLLAVNNLVGILALLQAGTILKLTYFAAAAAAGFLAAKFIFRGHWAVFLHELKHSIVSNLAGNRAKGMKIRRSHGHFEYAYSERTAAYNAFIHLAPYFLPLFTVVALLLVYLLLYPNHIYMLIAVGFACGADLALNVKDISPHQTDFINIRGGFKVGLWYVAAFNLTFVSFVVAWAMLGWLGPKELIMNLARLLAAVVQ